MAKKTTKKTAAKKKKPAAKKAASKRKPNAAFMKPMTPSSELAAIVGAKSLPRTEVTKKLWAYIKKNSLQDKVQRRNIHADDKLKPIFGKKTVNMFEMTKLVNKHLS
ncbi:MAG: SWIB/MDM2 domain-containing protein [Bacteriovoracia bacterium]